jgi:hypothetical protein
MPRIKVKPKKKSKARVRKIRSLEDLRPRDLAELEAMTKEWIKKFEPRKRAIARSGNTAKAREVIVNV